MRRPLVDVDAFERRVLLDAWLDATASYWGRRARELEAAMPRPGDFTGAATIDDVIGQALRLRAAADACRNRAALIDITTDEYDATHTDLTHQDAGVAA